MDYFKPFLVKFVTVYVAGIQAQYECVEDTAIN